MTKSLTLWVRPLCTLAALLGLEVHEYVFAPAGLASIQIRLREYSALVWIWLFLLL
jgi:hypothetical protein